MRTDYGGDGMRTDEMASEFAKGYDGGYALGFRRGVREGRLELLREDEV